MSNDIDFVDTLMKQAFNLKAPKMPDFASLADEEESSCDDNIVDFSAFARKSTVSQDCTAINDDDLDFLCAAGNKSCVDLEDLDKDE